MNVTRRQLIAGAAVTAAGAGLALSTGQAGRASAAPADSTDYLVGCGIGDVTGAVAGQGMMGYSNPEQVAAGLLQRCWARAYIIVDQATGKRVVFLTADIACLFQSHHMGLMEKLSKRFGSLYTEANVNLNAQHSHASCGGTAWDYAYSLAAFGFKKNSYDAEVNGMFAAIVRAHDNLAPGTITIGREELHNASANRSRVAFDANPSSDKKLFPNAIDPQVTVLRLRHVDGKDVGAITWFSTHGTSLADHNVLIAGDNKGYASYLWERTQPGFVAAFPQTNSGDMTPNLSLKWFTPSGPTTDNKRNCELIGERQYIAGRRAFDATRPMTRGGVDSVTRYVDMSAVRVSGTFTPDGKPASTTPAMMGAAAAATSSEDNYEQPLPLLVEGMTNPLVTALGGDKTPPIAPWMRDMQAPKLILFPLGLMPPSGWIPSVVPLQIMRIGELVLVAVPAEVTVVAGLRLRRVVADELRVDIDDVLVQGYANAYTQYVTTPEEYDLQQYEGGETQYGRYTLPAYMQEFAKLAGAMVSGRGLDRGPAPVDKSGLQPDLVPPVPADRPIAGHAYGDVLKQPGGSHRPGQTVTVDFVGAHPNNDFRHGGTYLEVQRREGGTWKTVADDNDWSTEFRWARPAGSTDTSRITITWRPAAGTSGTYRIKYNGNSRDGGGRVREISGTSRTFDVG
ncbi:neutral/alkaline ceramidase [Gordonia amicalis]|uniref:neutral/alkaline ceramidase n=1 Tax=Gordonia amicalis TaxID=89053 RepID=UPI0002A62BE7|nr:neutral/alkaline ceramidase [Gordonia amicalis]MBA5845807.1 neutral/alkaline ceramidase [Gordonia amicalis]MDJ0453784.1 neutral/alkaline ceramidase [Gordonia amicalis]MDV7076741.1 neutral/alkaline ceramidase [Gordonia amicalis]MDV7100405.1 neutral/alkaline ceramidase [Gordonia amicalis]MDV7173047.1 neutral/alkaline ceramidase [Gordonia amicalis]